MVARKTNYDDYVGKRVKLFPFDSYEKYAIIERVDDLGWTFRITKANRKEFEVNDLVFFSHASTLSMVFLDALERGAE